MQVKGKDGELDTRNQQSAVIHEHMYYTIVAQNADEVQDMRSAPAISMARFLMDSERMRLVSQISIYAERGRDRSQVRLLYMNDIALDIWKEMGMQPTEIGKRRRPTRTALLSFGMPFSDQTVQADSQAGPEA